MGEAQSTHTKSTATDREPKAFVTTLIDIPIRDVRKAMERPLFSLQKDRRTEPITHQPYNSKESILVTAPQEFGLATIYDRDILMWGISQIREACDKGLKPSPLIAYHPYRLLKDIKRDTGGINYKRLLAALQRLTATYVEHIDVEKDKTIEGFHWLESFKAKVNPLTGEPTDLWYMLLPQWLYQAALDPKQVLTISEDYFDIKGGTERVLYLLVRKHAGNQRKGWTCAMRTLYRKSGSIASYTDFAKRLRKIVKHNDLPDYWLSLFRNHNGDELLVAKRRSFLVANHPGYQPFNIRKMRAISDKKFPIGTSAEVFPAKFKKQSTQTNTPQLPFRDEIPF